MAHGGYRPIHLRVDLVEERFDFAIRVGPPGDRDLIALSLGDARAGLCQMRGRSADPERAIETPAELEGCAAGLFLRSNDETRPALRLTHAAGSTAQCAAHALLVAFDPWIWAVAATRCGLIVA